MILIEKIDEVEIYLDKKHNDIHTGEFNLKVNGKFVSNTFSLKAARSNARFYTKKYKNSCTSLLFDKFIPERIVAIPGKAGKNDVAFVVKLDETMNPVITDEVHQANYGHFIPFSKEEYQQALEARKVFEKVRRLYCSYNEKTTPSEFLEKVKKFKDQSG